MSLIRVLIADDDDLFCHALCDLIREDGGLEVVGVAAGAAGAASFAAMLHPDVVLLDVRMEGGGVQAADEIRRESPGTRVVALTAFSDRTSVLDMMRAGAVGYLVKGVSGEEILAAVHRAAIGEGSLSPNVAAEVIHELAGKLELEARDAASRQDRILKVREVLGGANLRSVLQPIVSLGTGRIVGVEALVRMDVEPPNPPDFWFAEAAEAGLEVELELAALRLALEHGSRLPEGVYLSVNLSPATVTTPGILDVLLAVSPVDLVVEITEHAVVQDYEVLGQALEGLRRRGTRVAVDDAGAGYASLRHILWLAPDIIKIDISLTRDIHSDRRRRALAAALITFAEELGATVVAEGIETQAELDALRSLGVGCGQGYYLGRPGELGYAELAAPVAAAQRTRPQRSGRLTGLREKIALIELQAAAIDASEASTIDEALRVALERICGHTGWPVGHALLLGGPPPAELVSSGIWHTDGGEPLEAFREATERLRFWSGIGLPGRVLQARSLILELDTAFDPVGPRTEEAVRAGLTAGYGFPLMAGSDLLGVFEFFSQVPETPDPSVLDILAAFGRQIGRVLERKQVELEVAESRSQLAEAQELAHIGSWRSRPSGEATMISDEMCRILGRDLVDPPLNLADVMASIHPDDRDGVVAAREAALGSGSPGEFEVRILRPDHRDCLAHGLMRPHRDGAGEIEWMEGALQDVTERRRAERVLREEARKLQLILDSLGEGVIVVDTAGGLVQSNPAANELLGIERMNTEAGEWSMRFGLHRSDGTLFRMEELPLFRAMNGETVERMEMLIVRPDRPEGLRITIVGRPLLHEDGTLEGGVIVFAEVAPARRSPSGDNGPEDVVIPATSAPTCKSVGRTPEGGMQE